VLVGAVSHEGNEGRTFRVALVQAGVHDARDPATPPARTIAGRYTSRSLALAERRPELIVWPASSVPYDVAVNASVRTRLARLSEMLGAPLLIGSSGRDKTSARSVGWQPAANSAFLFRGAGLVAQYDKMRLLAFNEYLPLRGLVPWPASIASSAADARSGAQRTVFDLGAVRFGVLICYESMFAADFREAARGADFVVSMTNEAFTHSSRVHDQMLAMNVFRAIENGVAVVRPATTGVSALIAPNGRILGRVPFAPGRPVEGDLVGDIPLGRDRAFYARWGDRVVAVLALGLVVLGALGGGARRWG
jgi:apolipoprotein N-acyltransferase